jgi:hypothetical protein
MRRIPILRFAMILLFAIAATAEPAVPEDLLAVLTLRGKPCGSIVSHERKGESDYLVKCSDGHRYRVFIEGNRVVIEDKK